MFWGGAELTYKMVSDIMYNKTNKYEIIDKVTYYDDGFLPQVDSLQPAKSGSASIPSSKVPPVSALA